MLKIAPLLLLFLASSAMADEYCQRPDKIDPEYPAGIDGRYEIIGRLPESDVAYTGQLQIANGTKAYSLRRTVAGKTITGEGWIEFCSADRYMVFKFRYNSGTKPFVGICYPRSNGDNYYIISCYTSDGTAFTHHGLESMFQLQAP